MTGQDNRLTRYKEQRNFEQTDEPNGNGDDFDWAKKRPLFIIQKHAASSLHYDFRLEVDGVLKSWAVPKGPSTDPREKRVAIPTEDHPLGYSEFEGVIAEGNYGAGTVMIWDRGSYSNLKHSEGDKEAGPVSGQIKDGHLTVWLDGEKIKGGYALIRTDRGDEERWLLIKMDDQEADARRNPTSTENTSVSSGRTLDEIRAEAGEQ